MMDKIKALHKEGQWPPEGHPWRVLALLPPEVVDQFLRGPVWQALVEGLSQLRDNAIEVALSSPELGKRDEARGVVNICRDIIDLEGQIMAFHQAIKES